MEELGYLSDLVRIDPRRPRVAIYEAFSEGVCMTLANRTRNISIDTPISPEGDYERLSRAWTAELVRPEGRRHRGVLDRPAVKGCVRRDQIDFRF
jgi:hypothetical protein